MGAIAEILMAEGTARNHYGRYVGEARISARAARLHACSPVHFLLSPFCRRWWLAGPCLTPSREDRQYGTKRHKDLMQKS